MEKVEWCPYPLWEHRPATNMYVLQDASDWGRLTGSPPTGLLLLDQSWYCYKGSISSSPGRFPPPSPSTVVGKHLSAPRHLVSSLCLCLVLQDIPTYSPLNISIVHERSVECKVYFNLYRAPHVGEAVCRCTICRRIGSTDLTAKVATLKRIPFILYQLV